MQGARTQSIADVLTQIWERLFQVPTIGPDDNFFDLGGDSALAVLLFAEIAAVCGQHFPPVMIYHVPTISSLAVLLEQRSTGELSPLILLKAGTQGTPVFIASGLGGGPAEFFQLVKHIRSANPIFGLQPKGIEGFDTPCERIEEMADFYLKAVLRYQPDGPYVLAGYSLGGLVALEMARTLKSSGKKVALLAMIDSYPDISALSSGRRLRLAAQRIKRRITNFGESPRVNIRLGGLPNAEAISTFAPALERVKDAAYRALRDYRPTPYNGAVKFVRAAEVTEFPEDPKTVWSHLFRGFETETVIGDHLSMLTKHYDRLAELLDRYLQETRQLPDPPRMAL